jgi:O-antigen/teichoic acid export membrane protein
MSRRKKALIATAFNYAQWSLGTVAAFYVTRLVLGALGKDVYGMWLATGAVLGYAALADLGILGVMPWLFAEADGAKDAPKLRSLLLHGLAVGFVGALVYALIASLLWVVMPGLLHLSPIDRAALRGPVMATIAFTTVAYPLRLFVALRTGLQDYSFLGVLSLVHTLSAPVITVSLTYAGNGLYGVALGPAVPGLIVGGAALVRTARCNPELFREAPGFQWATLKNIFASGTGQWFGTIGWQLAFASDSVIIAHLGYRSLVPVYSITSRLGLTLMQISWGLPDSTSVGLAQLNAEGSRTRVASVVAALLRFHLITAGAIACGVLAGNFGFVTGWTGADLYGGSLLNAVFALDTMALSVAHALVVPAAVLGARLKIGLVTLVNGGLHVVLALLLGRYWGLVGVAAATSISALLTSIPIGAKSVTELTSLNLRTLLHEILGPWLLRVVPCAAIALLAGWLLLRASVHERWGRGSAFAIGLFGGGAVGVVYLFGVRPMMRDLPFGPKLRRVLGALRLV